MNSLVHVQPVVGPKYFFGREMLLRSLHSGIQQKRSFIVIGGPKIGKTSLARQLIYLIEQKWQRTPDATKIVPVYCDLSNLSGGIASFAHELWQSILKAVQDPRIAHATLPNDFLRPDLLRAPEPMAVLKNLLQSLMQHLSGTPSWCQLIFILERADALCAQFYGPTLEFLLRLPKEKVTGSPLAVILCGQRHLYERWQNNRKTQKLTRVLFLGQLKMSEAKALIRSYTSDIEERTEIEMIQETGGHPFLLRYLLAQCSEDEYLCAPEIDRWQELGSAISPFFEQIWSEFDLDRGITFRGAYAAPEHALMQLLLDYPDGILVKRAERNLGIKPLREYFEFLAWNGLVERFLKSDKSFYRASCQFWNTWYRERINR